MIVIIIVIAVMSGIRILVVIYDFVVFVVIFVCQSYYYYLLLLLLHLRSSGRMLPVASRNRVCCARDQMRPMLCTTCFPFFSAFIGVPAESVIFQQLACLLSDVRARPFLEDAHAWQHRPRSLVGYDESSVDVAIQTR